MARHNKFGAFLSPQNFLNQNGPPEQQHAPDTLALDRPGNITGECKEAVENTAEKVAKEKTVAKIEARRARRERAKTQQAAAKEDADSTKAPKTGANVAPQDQGSLHKADGHTPGLRRLRRSPQVHMVFSMRLRRQVQA